MNNQDPKETPRQTMVGFHESSIEGHKPNTKQSIAPTKNEESLGIT